MLFICIMIFNKYLSLKILSFTGYVYLLFFLISKFLRIFLFQDIISFFIWVLTLIFAIEFYFNPIYEYKNLILKRETCQYIINGIYFIGILCCCIVLKWYILGIISGILVRKIIFKYKNFISLNLLSILGYSIFILILIFQFLWFPQTSTYSILNKESNFMMISYKLGLYKIFSLYYIICSILCYIALIEYIIRKKSNILISNIKLNDNLLKFHNFIYMLGLILILSPIIYIFISILGKFL